MSNKPQLFQRIVERQYSAHHALLETASIQLELSEQQQPGWFYNALVAITFSALTVEALSNAIGDRLITDWADFESSSLTAKLRLLTEKLGVLYARNQEPWNTIRWLAMFRNQVAHPKPTLEVRRSVISEAKRRKLDVDAPESKFERDVTLDNARKAVYAVRQLKELLCEKIPVEQLAGISTDGWSAITEPNVEA